MSYLGMYASRVTSVSPWAWLAQRASDQTGRDESAGACQSHRCPHRASRAVERSRPGQARRGGSGDLAVVTVR